MFPPERRSEAPEFKCVICGTIAEGPGTVCGSPACQKTLARLNIPPNIGLMGYWRLDTPPRDDEVAETIWGRLPLNAEERS